MLLSAKRYWVTGLLFLLLGASSARVFAPPAGEDQRALHVLNRLGYGARPGDLERLKEIGVGRYIDQQLHPESIALPSDLRRRLSGLNTLKMTPPQLFREYGPPMRRRAGEKPDQAEIAATRQRARVIVEQVSQARVLRAIYSPRQLQEVMVEFWFNHFNVFAGKGLDHLWVGSFEEQAIRAHAMGRFRELLGATARHPAMLFYLDNWLNTAPGSPGAHGKFEGINENYARELMELHTLGADGGYTQQDVIALARILTGWGLRRGPRAGAFAGPFFRGRNRRELGAHSSPDANGFYFDASRHDFGDKVFLGHPIKGSGAHEVEEALDILARSPATAHHIAYQLAQYFVADHPPETLVRRMAAKFIETDGSIRQVLATLFHSPEFQDPRYYGSKFKSPYQYVISAIRATGVEVNNIRPLLGTLYLLGMPPYGCQTPDGYRNTQEAWLNPDAMVRRLSFATALARGPLRGNLMSAGGLAPAAMAHGERMRAGGDGMLSASPIDAERLARTLGDRFSAATEKALEESPPDLRAALILGSPEFMRR